MMREEFLSKLSALLKEYNAEISFQCGDCCDTQSFYDDEIVIKLDDAQIFNSGSWYLDCNDIEKELKNK